VRAELRRTFGDMLEFREDFVKETLSVLDTLYVSTVKLSHVPPASTLSRPHSSTDPLCRYNFADALTTRGNSATLAEFHKQVRRECDPMH